MEILKTGRSFDLRPCFESTIEDLDIDLFKIVYQPKAVEKEIIEENHRDITLQLASLRLLDLAHNSPTNAGILLLGKRPLYYLNSAYVQYLKYDGVEPEPSPVDVRFSGPLVSVLKSFEDFIRFNIIKHKAIRGDSMAENNISNYPFWAMRELMMNAIMHRDYESNAPIYINEFDDRIEIINPGGLFGDVRPENFPDTSDYRNLVLAEALKVLGYINKYNFGIRHAQRLLADNGNPPAVFNLALITKFKVTVYISNHWQVVH
ncbi:MAG: hypothetical protein H7257_06385 [Taibaiella sp.]|nr:hypothetical protein [Taibaiella sp.]